MPSNKTTRKSASAPAPRVYQYDSLRLLDEALTVRIEERFGIDVFEAGVVDRWEEIRTRVTRHAAGRK